MSKEALQEQQITARKNLILDAAAKVFAEKGFHPTTIRDIAKQAGIADGTIYNYFDNKPALLVGIFNRMRESLQPDASLLPQTTLGLRDFLKLLTYPLIVTRQNNFELFRVIVSEMMVNPELRALYYEQILSPMIATAEHLFEQWSAQGIIRSDNPPLTMRLISSMILGLMLQHVMGDQTLEQQWDQVPDALADLVMSGLTDQTTTPKEAEDDQS